MISHAPSLPRMTLILPTYNRKERFARVLEAVLEDKRAYPDLEIIVVDGGSTDGTQDVIRAHAADIAWSGIGSDGIYGALNVGLRHATGEYVRMVSDDDEYFPGHIHALATYCRAHPSMIVGGAAECIVDGKGVQRIVISTEVTIRHVHDFLHWPIFRGFFHECLFFPREALVRRGGWNTGLSVSGDVELIAHLIAHGTPMMIVPTPVMRRHFHGGSMSQRHFIRARFEVIKVVAQYGSIGILVGLAYHDIRRALRRFLGYTSR